MRVVLSIGNVIIITLVSFLGIIGLVVGLRKAENIPFFGNVAKGGVSAWEAAAA